MKLNNVMHNLLNALIIIDIILISVSLFVPNNIFPVLYFDIFVCILLLIDWVKDLYNSNPKSDFLKKPSTWVSLIASIPFQVLLPVIIPGVNLLRYFRLLKLLRVLILFDKFFDGFIILAGVFVTIILFTAIFHTFGSSYTLFDYFYLVVVTITTVGYGDIVPLTFAEKVISICLIVTGMFVFSLTTAGISSFLTDRLLKNDINDITLKDVKSDLENIHKENMSLKEEVRDLKDEIHELKDLLNKKD